MTLDRPFEASRAIFLHQLQQAQAADSALVVQVADAPSEQYVQFLFLDRTNIVWEVGTIRPTPGFRLWRKDEVFLTPQQQAALQTHGFRYDSRTSPNYRRDATITDSYTLEQIVDESCAIFITVYHTNPAATLSFEQVT